MRLLKAFFLALILTCVFSTDLPAKDPVMSVQVRSGVLRSTPTFLGANTGNLEYGEKLTIQEKRGDWFNATSESNGRSGWIHSSAVTKKDIKMQSGDAAAEVKASSGELALAGKGFNSDVEAEFKSKNSDMDFTWVDKMEKIKITPQEMINFLRKGQIAPKAGAQ